MKRILLLMALVMQTLLMVGADQIVKADDSAISFTGRTETLSDGSVRYDWVGVYMQTSFTGGRIAVEVAETGTSYHNVYISPFILIFATILFSTNSILCIFSTSSYFEMVLISS